jgi:GMP synthase-like glutamine amidotransferase
MAFTLGILNVDQLSAPLHEDYISYSVMFQRLLHVAQSDLQFRTYNVVNSELPDTPKECDAWLITGSRKGVYDEDQWIQSLRNWIALCDQQKARLIGICFGHQLIADTLGGRAEKSEKGWGLGVMPVKIVKQKAWMKPALKGYSLIVSHQDQVTALPPHAEKLAGSDFCEYAAFSIGEHILCFQGHPEFTKDYSRRLMALRRGVLTDQQINKGMATLEKEVDARVVAHWLCRFMGALS